MSQFIEMFGNPVTNTKGWKTAKIKDVAPEMPSKEQLSGKIWLLNLDMIESNTGRIIEKVDVYKRQAHESLKSLLWKHIRTGEERCQLGHCKDELVLTWRQ